MLRRLAAATLVLNLAACADPEPLRIGFLGELTGRLADLAEAERNGVIMAVEEFRVRDKLGGREVEIIARDSGTERESAIHAAEELISQRVDLIIGPATSGVTDHLLPVIEAAKVVMIAPTAAAMRFVGQDDHLIRVNWSTRDTAEAYAAHLFRKQFTRIAVALNVNNKVFSDSTLEEFRSAFVAIGGEITTSAYFDSNSPNFGQVVSELLASRPAAVLMIGNAVDVARLSQQFRKQDQSIQLVAAEWAATDKLIQFGGRAVEGLRLVQNFDPDDHSPRFLEFTAAYIKRFGRTPEFGSIVGYDAAVVALTALTRRSRGMTVKEAILSAGPYQGLQQTLALDRYGDMTRPARFLVIRDGRFVKSE